MKMWLLQGLPGSGKSTQARLIAREYLAVILSTDDYHYHPSKPHIYDFQYDRAAEYHKLNQQRCRHFMGYRVPIIIDNTNLTNWAIAPYVRMARDARYEIEIITCNGDGQSLHNVPANVMEHMRKQMQKLDLEVAFNTLE